MAKPKWSNPMKKLEIGEKYYFINKVSIQIGKLKKIETDINGTKYTMEGSMTDLTTKRKPNTSIDDLIEIAVEEYKERLLEEKEKYEKRNN